MRLASHHALRRAGSTSLCPPQFRKSGEKDIQISACGSVQGRCRRAKRPLTRRGSSALSLSSGCMTNPYRSNVRKSLASASATLDATVLADSSTRQSRSVVPSGRRVAPSLNTVWAGYSQFAAVRMDSADAAGRVPRSGQTRSCHERQCGAWNRRALGPIGRAHLAQCRQERERRFRALVSIDAVGMEPMAVTATSAARRYELRSPSPISNRMHEGYAWR